MPVAPAAHVRPAPRLRHRPATRADLPECMTLIPAWLALDDATRAGPPETAAPADRLQYFRVTRDEAIALVPDSSIGHIFSDAAGDDDGKRGRERRRQVLAYVRQRPEELRPWVVAP